MKMPRKMLIVEDLPTDAELTMREVRKILPDSEFLCVETQADFLAALADFSPDIILCDYKLPQFDGLSALALSQTHAPDTPFIVVTGSMDEYTAVDCMKAGVWEYVIKEDIKRLRPAVMNAWEQKRRRLEQKEAREKSQRWERLFEKAQFGLAHADAVNNTYIKVNTTFAHERGYSPEALEGQPVVKIFAPEERDRVTRIFQDLNDRQHIVFESEHLRKDGSRFPVLMEITLIRDGHGRPVSRVCYALDITERKQADVNLHKIQALLNETQRLARMGGWEYDVLSDQATWTDEVFRIHGLSKDYDPGKLKDNIAFYAPEDRDKISKAFYTALHNGTPYDLELRFITAQGEKKWVRTIGQAEIKAGKIVRLYGNIVDITADKQAEAERDQLTAAINQAGESILITDVNGKIQYVNPAFEKVSGYGAKEVIGKTPRIFKSGQHDTAFYQQLWETIASGRTWSGHIVNKRKNGQRHTEAVTISPVRDPAGAITNYVAVKRDITDQLSLEKQFQQVQKLESLGRLASGVAHDFNNILGVIIGYAELALEQMAPDAPVANHLMEILTAAGRSRDITRQLLAVACKQTASPKILDLNQCIENILKMLRRLIGEDIELVWRPGSGLRPVKIDPSQVDQILANLCINARDAIAGVGHITIETHPVRLDNDVCAAPTEFTPGHYLQLTVKDDGNGMDPKTLENIFEPFFTTKEPGKGTGLGLATVYGIVRQNDGFISVDSEPGKGAAFKIYLPEYKGKPSQPKDIGAVKHHIGQGESILLVEDDAALLNMITRMIERLSYHVLTARTPYEAIRLAESQPQKIDLLITDVVMPAMNGRELAVQIKSVAPHVRCLFMSGYPADVIARQGILNKGVQLIHKPFTLENLSAAIHSLLNQQEPELVL